MTEFYSLLGAVGSEFIADQFGIGTYTNKHDFESHLKVDIFERTNPSDSLIEFAEKTSIYTQIDEMTDSIFSRQTNDRAVVAIVRLLFDLLHSYQSYHHRGVQHKYLKRLD